MLKYQHCDSVSTLSEGLAEYRASNADWIGATVLDSVVVLPRVLARCRRMSQRWPWTDFDRCHPVALLELRREYGIEVVTVG